MKKLYTIIALAFATIIKAAPVEVQTTIADVIATNYTTSVINSKNLASDLSIRLAYKWLEQGKYTTIVVLPADYINVANQLKSISIPTDLVMEKENPDKSHIIRLRRYLDKNLYNYIDIIDSIKGNTIQSIKPIWHILIPSGNQVIYL